ncbi:MAG: hypothetical protein ACI9C0_000316, partial [Alteromonadaceae bacterium]
MFNNSLFLLFLMLLSGCQTTQITKGEAFPDMYNEKPTSILVVPAINLTTAADAAAL